MNEPQLPNYPDSREALLQALKSTPPESFVAQQVLDRVPWVFSNRWQYIDWKKSLAEGLEVDPFAIVVVGSACLGFSLSPIKRYSAFHARSDIDVAVVSQRHFEEAWRWLRQLGALEQLTASKRERKALEDHKTNLVFNGAIATDRILGKLSFGPQWRGALSRAGNREPTIGRTVKARVYRDFESLREYHLKNVRNRQRLLLAGEE